MRNHTFKGMRMQTCTEGGCLLDLGNCFIRCTNAMEDVPPLTMVRVTGKLRNDIHNGICEVVLQPESIEILS